MKIETDAKLKRKKLHDFWNHIHFHPADAIEDIWGKDILDKVADEKMIGYLRIHTMLEDVVSRQADGSLAYDFSITDSRLDYLSEKGFKLILIFAFMPVAIAGDPALFSSMKRYKGKRFNFSEPADYNEWKEVCRVYTQHLLDRYGLEKVSSWYMECWNEPDHSYWMNNERHPSPEQLQEKVRTYCKLYDYFVEGVISACDKLRIGGPSAAGKMPFIEAFLEHCREGTNDASGEKGTRLDYISFHEYTMSPSGFANGQHPCVERLLDKTERVYESMKRFGYAETEMVINEWEAVARGFDTVEAAKEVIYRETEYFPAFFAKTVERYIQAIDVLNLPLSIMMICYSGQHDVERDFDGRRALFTMNMFPKPIYNMYVLLKKLGTYLLHAEIKDKQRNIGAIPTADEKGNVKILIYQLEENVWKSAGNQKVSLKLNGLNGHYRIKQYNIDRISGNSYSKWVELGRPKNPNQWECELMKQAGKLKLHYPEETVDVMEELELDIVLLDNCVCLIEVEKDA